MVLSDVKEELKRALNFQTVPMTFLLDQEGNIVKVANRIDQLRPEIDRLMAEAAN